MAQKEKEYHLIDLMSGESHGGFRSLEGAREYAREEGLATWDIWNGNRLIERHNPLYEEVRSEHEDGHDSAHDNVAPRQRSGS